MRPWDLPEFATGLRAGAVAAVALLLAAGLGRWWRWPRPIPLLGLAFAAAGAWVVDQTHAIPGAALVGMVGVAVVAGAVDRARVPAVVPVLLAAPFGCLIGFHGGLVDIMWVRVAVAAAAALGGPLAASTDRAWRAAAVGPLLLALTVAGVYATVPDTEEAVALLGVVAPITVLGWPIGLAHLGRSGSAAAVALTVWVAAVDGVGRLPSIIGALGTLGLLVCWPVGAALGARLGRGLRRPAPAAAALVAAHAVVVAVASRAIGLGTDVRRAGLFVGLLALAAVAVGAALPAPPAPDAEDDA